MDLRQTEEQFGYKYIELQLVSFVINLSSPSFKILKKLSKIKIRYYITLNFEDFEHLIAKHPKLFFSHQ